MPYCRDFIIAAEAMLLALPVEIGLRFLALDVLVAKLGSTRGRRDRLRQVDVQRAAHVIERISVYYPLRATCLKKSLVLFRILRARGIPADLRLGVRKVHDDLNAHAWIECQGHALLGDGIEHLYSTLPLASRATGHNLRHEGADPLR